MFFVAPRDNLAMRRFLQTPRQEDCLPRLALTMLPTESRGAIPDFRSLPPCLGEESVMPKNAFSPGELNLSNEFSRQVGPEAKGLAMVDTELQCCEGRPCEEDILPEGKAG